jgi:hypothetical protein
VVAKHHTLSAAMKIMHAGLQTVTSPWSIMILSPWYSNSRIYETPADHVTPCCNPPLYSRAEVILNFSSVSRKQNLHTPLRNYGAGGGALG